MKFRNVNTGVILTELELKELHIREYKEMYNQPTESMNPIAYSCKFEDKMSLREFVDYMEENDCDTDFVEVDKLEILKSELIGKELSFLELDNYMGSNGYYTVFNDGVGESVKESKNVVYTATDTNSCEVMIDFEITADNGEDEMIEAFYLKVTDVSEF